jgi:hypothetical protein
MQQARSFAHPDLFLPKNGFGIASATKSSRLSVTPTVVAASLNLSRWVPMTKS